MERRTINLDLAFIKVLWLIHYIEIQKNHTLYSSTHTYYCFNFRLIIQSCVADKFVFTFCFLPRWAGSAGEKPWRKWLAFLSQLFSLCKEFQEDSEDKDQQDKDIKDKEVFVLVLRVCVCVACACECVCVCDGWATRSADVCVWCIFVIANHKFITKYLQKVTGQYLHRLSHDYSLVLKAPFRGRGE